MMATIRERVLTEIEVIGVWHDKELEAFWVHHGSLMEMANMPEEKLEAMYAKWQLEKHINNC